jgi:hypothetical protein
MISRILLVVAVFFGAALQTSNAAPQSDDTGITILYSADERGEIEPCG